MKELINRLGYALLDIQSLTTGTADAATLAAIHDKAGEALDLLAALDREAMGGADNGE